MRCFEIKIIEEDMVDKCVMVGIRERRSILDLGKRPLRSVPACEKEYLIRRHDTVLMGIEHAYKDRIHLAAFNRHNDFIHTRFIEFPERVFKVFCGMRTEPTGHRSFDRRPVRVSSKPPHIVLICCS